MKSLTGSKGEGENIMARFRSNNTWEQQQFYHEAREAMRRQRQAESSSGGDIIAKVFVWIAAGVLLLGIYNSWNIGLTLGIMLATIILGVVFSCWATTPSDKGIEKKNNKTLSSIGSSTKEVKLGNDKEEYTDDSF